MPLALALASLGAFLPSAYRRAQQAARSGSQLGFSWLAEQPDYLAYNHRVLFGSERQRIAAIQAKVPRGETLIAWINAPFYLDYRRNRIIDAEVGGLSNSWAFVPRARYIIWDYAGYATIDDESLIENTQSVGAMERRVATRGLEFSRRMRKVKERHKVLFDDGRIALIRLDKFVMD